MAEQTYYAHSLRNPDGTPRPQSEWEPLYTGDGKGHLERVGQLAAEFSDKFEAEEWGRLAGLWHDLGKYQEAFQRRLRGDDISVEHAGAGATHAARVSQSENSPLSFVIAGHHGGLPNLRNSEDTRLTPLKLRLKRNKASLNEVTTVAPIELLKHKSPQPPKWLKTQTASVEAQRRRGEFFTRMLFSTLVDSDSLVTAAFCNPDSLPPTYDRLETLRVRLDSHIDRLCQDSRPTEVNQVRRSVLEDCRAAASQSPNCFSLTVPTGGGKTLAAMSFALNHAVLHNRERVIVVVPYTSIIEQNAKQYADSLGAQNVVEHHSNLDDFDALDRDDETAVRRQRACENWDAPVIVTTTVQFFESLFANRRSRARKLHNIANSVVILDEAQCLPIDLLDPILDVLGELLKSYGITIVLSTATQPALHRREALPTGLPKAKEIVSNAARLSRQLRRVTVTWPQPDEESVSLDVIASRLVNHDAVLAIVHKRKDAADLARLVASDRSGDPLFHLSALMCAEHRRERIGEIHAALKKHRLDGSICRVVSTQLVEAGVDLDFPVVYRAMAGLDSIAQAAGRCNREGDLNEGQVIVFRGESQPPGLTLQHAAETTETLLKSSPNGLDICRPEIFDQFFRAFYATEPTDKRNVQRERAEWNFEMVARLVRLIEDGYQQPIVVLFNAVARRRADELRAAYKRFQPNIGRLLRGLQPFTVQIPPRDFQRLRAAGKIEDLLEDESVWVLDRGLYPSLYSDQFGLVVDEYAPIDIESLVL